MKASMERHRNIGYSAISLLDKFLIQDISLNLFQKVLLVTDGTVTDLLKLYSGKNIQVKIVSQELMQSGEEEFFLCPDKTDILKRRILLCNESTNYIYADSIFIVENISKSAQNKLLQTNQPIGLIWKDEKIETYREIIDYKLESCGLMAEYFGVPYDTQMVSRVYLIYSNGRVLGMITEKFPITHFSEVD